MLSSFSHVWFFATLWPVACQAPLSMEILQERALEWVAIPFSRGSSWSKKQTWVSCIAGGLFTIGVTREAPLSQWYHSTISSSVVPFSSRFQSFPASQSFPMSRFFASGGQNIRASASASFLPMNIQGWFPLGLTGSISLLSSQESSPAPQFESINSSMLSLLHGPTLTSVHDYWKNHSSDYTDLFGKVMSLLFNTLSRFVIAFLPRSKWLLIS